MSRVIVTSNEDETMSVGEELAREIREIKADRSIVIFLEGELGVEKECLKGSITKN